MACTLYLLIWKHKPLCFLMFPLYFRSFFFLSLSLSLSRWFFTPWFVSRSSFLPCSSYALASFACPSFVFVFLSRLFCLFPDLLSLQVFRQTYLLRLCFRSFLSHRSGFRISQSFSSSYFLLVFHRSIAKFATKRFAACFSTSLAGISVSFRAHLIAVKLLPNKKETRWLTPTSTSFLQGQLMRVCK
jgi:hypothetical protein